MPAPPVLPQLLLLDVLDREYFHNTLRAWLIFAATVVAGAALLALLRYVVVLRLERFAVRTHTQLDDLLLVVLRRTRSVFFLFIALFAAARLLALPAELRGFVHGATVVVLLLQIAIWTNAAISFWVHHYALNRAATEGASVTTITALGVVARLALFAVLVLIGLQNLGVQVSALVTGLGITGVAVALAVQNILGDLFGALSIVLDKPFIVGDSIGVDQINGTVEHIGLKSTRLRSVSGEQIIVSNKDLLESRVRNFKRMSERRVAFTFGVTYDAPPELLERLPAMVKQIVEAQPQVRFDRSHLARLGDSSVDFETVYFVLSPDYALYMNTQQAINLAILRRLSAEGASLAYPTRRLLVEGTIDTPTRGDTPNAGDGARSSTPARPS